jgi:signal transduction histidine kinase
MTISLPQRRRHELKNQLGIVLGFSELLMQEMGRDDPRRADIEEIHTAAARALALVAEEQDGPV